MIKRYTKLAKNLLMEVRDTDLIKLAVYTAVSAAANIWPVIALEDAGYGTSVALTIFAADNFTVMLLLAFFSVFLHKKNWIKHIWFFLTWISALGWVFLSVTKFDLTSAIGIAVLAVTAISSYVAMVCLFADTLDQVQTNDASSIKLALFFLLVPLTRVSFISFGGFLAEIDFTYVATFFATVLIISNLVWRDHVVLHTVKVASVTKIWHMFDNGKRFLLMSLSMIFNSLNIPVRFVFIPLYFYEQIDGSPGKLGAIMGMLGIVALLAHTVKKYIKGQSLDSFKIMVVGVSLYACVPIVWYLFYDMPWVVGGALIVAQILGPVWSFGFFIELRELSQDSPTVRTQQWQVVNAMGVCLSCFVLSFLTNDLMAYIKPYLLMQFMVLMGYIFFFIYMWKKKFTHTTGQ